MVSPISHPFLSHNSADQAVAQNQPSSTEVNVQAAKTNGAGKPLPRLPVVGDSMLRDHASHIDPLQIHGEDHFIHHQHITNVNSDPHLFPAESILSGAASLPAEPLHPSPRAPTSVLGHRKNGPGYEVPLQTIMKALASRSSGSQHTLAAPMAPSLSGFSNYPIETEMDGKPGASSSQRLSAALNTLQMSAAPGCVPSTARFPLKSPCYFHQRFDDAVNIEKVLEEIGDDEWLSHSRLMQTATGVREVSKQLSRRPIKRAVRNVMIVTKARDNALVYLTRELAEWLLSAPRNGSDVGVNVYVDAKLRTSTRFDASGLLEKDRRFEQMLKYWTPDLCWTSPEIFDLVLTLGGDGTVLFTSWLFQRIVPPILSFSLGSLGFLTNFKFDSYKEHLDQIMGDAGMRVNLRMRFTCTVWRADRSPGAAKGAVEEGDQFEVLNELVIDRGPSPYVSNLELYGDNELLTVVQADGCIFSTPTGSTAYSLSAGGSLIHPSIPAILLTPICPHTLSFRPMVLSDALALRIAVPAHSRSTAYCSFDGKGRIELKQGDHVTLEASQYPFPTVMAAANEWIHSVQRALRWNVRGAMQKGWDDGHDCQEDDDDDEEKWDIDTDAGPSAGTDSGIGPSEDGGGAGAGSPVGRQMSLLSM